MTAFVPASHRLWALVLICFASACGGGGSGGGAVQQDPQPEAVVEVLSSVRQVSTTDQASYAVASETSILYTGPNPPAVGSVMILDGAAYKVLSTATAVQGATVLTVGTPDVEDVFERLEITGATSFSPTPFAVERERAAGLKALPDFRVDRDVSVVSDGAHPVDLWCRQCSNAGIIEREG